MIARLCITLTLASALCTTATLEAKREFNPGTKTKLVAGLAITAGLAGLVHGISNRSHKVFASSIGILTGLGCAALEHYTQTMISNDKLMPFIMASSWTAEKSVRFQAYADVGITEPAIESRKASWASYLVYHVARYADASE